MHAGERERCGIWRIQSYLVIIWANTERRNEVPSLSGKAHEIPLRYTRTSETERTKYKLRLVIAAVIYFFLVHCSHLET